MEGVGEVGLSAAVGEGTRVGPAGGQSGGRGGGGYRRMSFGRVASGCDLAPYLGMAASSSHLSVLALSNLQQTCKNHRILLTMFRSKA